MSELYVHSPRHGPEWGSGGIFGLTYYKGVLYYTLAMEALSRFIHEDGHVVEYRFEQIGPGPASGGDTYNAVDAVDDEIFFGGWVHNPALYKGRRGKGGEIDFRNKYSHVHVYDLSNKTIKLLWKDSIHHEYEWAGEISQIVYDPVNDRLLLARSDGHRNLGVYQLPRRGGEVAKLSDVPALKGSLYLDFACFDMQPNWYRGIDGVQCVDLVERDKVYKFTVESWDSISVDGYGVEHRWSGYAISAYARYFHFFRGGYIAGNPVEPEWEEPVFVRLFDFGPVQYSPQRSMAVPLRGGILAAFSSMVHGVIRPGSGMADEHLKLNRFVVGPSILVYIAPPLARIVGVAGARITGLAIRGDEVLVAYNTDPNLGGLDATPVDTGRRYLGVLKDSALLSGPQPPVTFRVYGWMVRDRAFGGIPLAGYKEPEIAIYSSRNNKLEVSHYDSGLPSNLMEKTSYNLSEGVTKIALTGYHGIVSFKLAERDDNATIYIYLK